MRASIPTPLLTLAALLGALVTVATLGASSAHAQGLGDWSPGRCMDRPMAVESVSLSSRLLSADGKTASKSSELLASTVRPSVSDVHRVSAAMVLPFPGRDQSRAPVMCTDPSQPGCHVDVPETPGHHGWTMTLADGGVVTLASCEVPPPSVVVHHWATPAVQRLPRAVTRSPWRPPAV